MTIETPVLRPVAGLAMALLLGCGASDEPDASSEPEPTFACTFDKGAVAEFTAPEAKHVDLDTEVTYSSVPPCIGNHYGQWSSWGIFEQPVDPRYFVHNLEHGGMTFLYDCPAGCADLVTALTSYVVGVPDDDSGPFRAVVSPYAGLGSTFAIAAWGWTYKAETFDGAEVDCFVKGRYRHAPEDIALGGNHAPDP